MADSQLSVKLPHHGQMFRSSVSAVACPETWFGAPMGTSGAFGGGKGICRQESVLLNATPSLGNNPARRDPRLLTFVLTEKPLP